MRSRITPVVLNLLIINGIVYLLEYLVLNRFGTEVFSRYFLLFKLNPAVDIGLSRELFEPIQIVTHFFSHSPNSIFHILFNMFALYSIGQGVEHVMGSRRFISFYLFSGVVGGILTALFDPSPAPVLGASGAVSGVAMAFALIFPNQKLMIFPLPIPFSAWKLIGFFFLLSLGFVVYSFLEPGKSLGGISHFGHLAGMVAALLYIFGGSALNRMRK